MQVTQPQKPALVSATVGLGVFSSLLAATSINVAIPNIVGAFGINTNEGHWLSTGYFAASTIAMLLCSWLIRRAGVRTTFLFCTVIFILGSIAGAHGHSYEMIVFARILQGGSAGLLLPLASTTIFLTYPVTHQGRAMGAINFFAVMAPAVGPYLGGVLLDESDWRIVFYLSVPLSLISIPMAVFFLGESGREQQVSNVAKFDFLSLTLLAVTVTSLLVCLAKGEEFGWLSTEVLSGFLLAIVTFALFLQRQARSANPLLNLNLFRYRNYCGVATLAFVFGAGLYSSAYLLPYFLQDIQGLTATNAGLAYLPGGILVGFVMPLSGRLADKVHPAPMVIVGLVIFAWSNYMMRSFDWSTSFLMFVVPFIIGRIGLAVIIPPLNTSITKSMPPSLVGGGIGASLFFRQLGAAFGVSAASAYFSARASDYLDALRATQNPANAMHYETVDTVGNAISSLNIGGELETQMASMQALSHGLMQVAKTLAYQDAFVVTALVFLVAVVPACYLTHTRHSANS